MEIQDNNKFSFYTFDFYKLRNLKTNYVEFCNANVDHKRILFLMFNNGVVEKTYDSLFNGLLSRFKAEKEKK